MPLLRLVAALAAALVLSTASARADEPAPSRCMAIARALPHVTYASFTPAMPAAGDPAEVEITYAGHSTYVIETPAGVRIATDYSGVYGSDPLPRVVTMNHAHRTHYAELPDPRIEHVLRGWNPEGGPARHALTVGDVHIRNVPTDIRNWGGGMERDGNSIFIFEVADLCIGHLGHLHHGLENAHYAAIGRLDVVMAPIDGGMTLSLDAVSDIAKRLYASMILPMHRHATPLGEFTSRMGEGFDVEFRAGRTLTVSQASLPRRPTIVVLDGI